MPDATARPRPIRLHVRLHARSVWAARRKAGRRWAGATLALAASLVLAGCASFPDSGPRDWREKPELDAQAGPQPQVPGEPSPGQQPGRPQPQPSGPPAAPQGCVDPDPQVIATCLDSVTAIAVLPGGVAALVAERSTGRVLRVEQGVDPVVVATLPVDPAATDGGVTGLALSPSYNEDELIYAYITTITDNRVMRIAPGGDPPKPVLTGIPRGPVGNAGSITADGKGALLVATGDAGSAANADNPASLAGKVLRIDSFGAVPKDNPDPASRVLATGLHNPGGLCVEPVEGGIWVTDRPGIRDTLYRVQPGKPVGAPAWTWPERPGVAGCVAVPGLVAVALTLGASLFVLHPAPNGTSFTGKPETTLKNAYGRLYAAALGPDGLLWLGTVNKVGGKPVSSDDRVIRIQPPSAGGGGVD
jgi:glucose/arabinose dehydrogenase